MSKLYACIISPDLKRDEDSLLAIARQFSHRIQKLDDGVLFDVSGLERLIGKPDKISKNILEQLGANNLAASLAIAETVDSATLLARQNTPDEQPITSNTIFQKLPLKDLDIDQDTLNVFNDLGLRQVQDLLDIPRDELINRYGREFERIIDVITEKGRSMITPNTRENSATWAYHLDAAVDDFEQLIFIINHGLDSLLTAIGHDGLSTEHLDLEFTLSDKSEKRYEIKTSLPTIDKTFWLKLINLRVSLAPPEAAILSITVTANFTKPRPAQKGLYAVSRPEPESLLLTVNKLKKLVGEQNVGVPVILNQRSREAFALDADEMPSGDESPDPLNERSVIAFCYYRPPINAEVLVRDGRLIFIKTQYFSGRVIEYSGVWKANSKWWHRSWKTQEWDVEIENKGVYRLCKVDKQWFLAGEYD